ncbi:2-enoyl thioester reductase domain-containing protein [Pelagicoccus sp. SDUM812002]|uniref:MDR family NADPH-dependent oxidoreductase n=1 Tax=Pelagicoccus sp. SDUM812002 TaxID=3041266 RepID=UPI00280F1752|nr:2-enoyl thioester reductase domain-containing protein [Pelagicoccus sp. SDUM812002]MDQ8186527.1 2-enoyl thioester reductase domain-containing protein [Pelagicoccus sp. SDUM812002]
MHKTTALRYETFGKPEEALSLESTELPELGRKQALLKVLAAPINPADFGRIGGTYGELAKLPATAGLEGVAEVIAVGSSDCAFRVGQHVFVPSVIGSWQSHAIANCDELFPAPEKLPIEQAAMGWVNPATAWKLMHDFAKLQAGDIIVQNAATSAVGKLVIQIASHLGIKTINLVRNLDAESHLKKLGASIVLVDDRDAAKAALEETWGKRAKIALNSVGGSSALGMCKMLANGGTLITFGAMDREPAPFPTRYLIFNDIRLRGFWVSKWYATAPREEILALHNEVFNFMENAKIRVPVAATYPLEDWQTALEHSQTAGKTGKILFKP